MKKLIVTKKYLMIIALSVVLGAILSIVWYTNLEKAAAPEKEISVLVFTRSLGENKVLTREVIRANVGKKSIPISLVPRNGVLHAEDIYDMTLIESVREGDYVVMDMLTERGHTTFEAGDYWQISINVSELTNFLGLQLKRGDEYQLYYRKNDIDPLTASRSWGQVTDQVYVVDLVDHLGNKVFEEREENIKSVILAMPDQEAYELIIEMKEDVQFELGKAPDNYWELLKLKNAPMDQELFLEELRREKLERRLNGNLLNGGIWKAKNG